jgi:MIP family channel proteins
MANIRAPLVEVLGTFFLCFVGGLAVYGGNNTYGQSLINVAFAHGFIIFAMICWGGPISGAHYNPAVTVAMMVNGDQKPAEGIIYIVSQFIGSFLAGGLLALSLPDANKDNKNYGTSPELRENVSQYQGFILEFIATFTLVLMIVTGVRTKKPEQVIGAYVGITLMSFINGIGPLTGASLNPARTLGPFMFSNGFVPLDSKTQPFFVYYVAPILGGVAGGTFSKYVIHSDESLKEINGEEKVSDDTYDKMDNSANY